MAEPYLIEESPFVDDVAASVIVETPATAGSATDGAAAPGGAATLPAAAIKFADLTESGSESGDEPDAAAEAGTSTAAGDNEGRNSPPPNCAICLSRCRRKCFTDSCLHQFCFKCLCEWSKIKPECPLCKQPFKTIIHNVRTLDDYDRYPVQTDVTPQLPDHSLRFHIVNIRRPRYMPLVQNQAVMTSANEIDAAAESEDGIPTVEPSRILPPVNRFEPYRTELMNFYRHDQDAGSVSSLSQLWRRYVYDRKLYALPVSDSLTGHFREWSARFYRDNPAQMHRLMPWINRDIVCLLRNSTHSVSDVMHLMHDILPMTNILGPGFRRRLSPYLGDRTSHFIHELFNFARSPYDMIGYDLVVQYSARMAEEVEVDLLDMMSPLSSNAGEVEGDPPSNAVESSNEWQPIAQSRTPRPSTSVIVTNPSATHSFSVTMATDGSELPGISIRRTTTSNVGSQTVAINLSMRRPASEVIEIDDGDGDAAANAEVAAINDNSNSSQGRRNAGATLPVSAHIELQSSDSACNTTDDECIFVLERKPPHLRTPELVSLDSGSDSDVVFVDEQKPSRPPAPATDKDQARANVAAAMANELFMGPSTSTGVCSTSGKNWKKVLEEARRQDRILLRSYRLKPSTRRATYMPYRCSVAGPPMSAGLPTSSESSSSTSSSSSSSDSNSDSEGARTRLRESRSSKRKRRALRNIAQSLSKRSRRQMDYDLDNTSDSSSDSSSGSTSDSTENLQLSALRATLKAEAATTESNESVHDGKFPKVEQNSAGSALNDEAPFQAAGDARVDVVEAPTTPKRRRSYSSSCLDANLSSHSSVASSVSFCTSSSSALSIFNTDANDANDPLVRGSAASPHLPTSETMDHLVHIANSLIELPTTGQQRASAVFNDQSASVQDAISFLRNALPNSANSLDDDAHLGIYSDASNDVTRYQLEPAIDVVGDVSSLGEEHGEVDDNATATTEDNDEGDHEIDNNAGMHDLDNSTAQEYADGGIAAGNAEVDSADTDNDAYASALLFTA